MRATFVLLAVVVGCSEESQSEICPPIGCANAAFVVMRVAVEDARLLSANIELCRNEQCARAAVTRLPDAVETSVGISLAGAIIGSAILTREALGEFSISAQSPGTGPYPYRLVDGDRYVLRVLGNSGSKIAETSFTAKFTESPASSCPPMCRWTSHDAGSVAVEGRFDGASDASGSD